MMNRRTVSLTIFLLLAGTCSAGAQTLPRAEIAPQPECVHPDKAALHFPGSREAQDRVYALLDSLLEGGGRSLNVYHIGGSHVQAGHFSYRLQERLTSMAPGLKGERGFLFPYRIAKTNSDKSFRTSYTGTWQSAMAAARKKDFEARYGIMGIAVRTYDSLATVGLGLGISADTLWKFNSIRVMGYGSSEAARPFVITPEADTLRAFAVDSLTSSYVFSLPSVTDTVSIGFDIPQGESFTLTGLEPLSGRTGINYFCSGVNGAQLTTWLQGCQDLGRDMELVHPDLAIFAVGINDSACKAVDFNAERFKERYRALISLIRRSSPDCAFIFVTNNDSYRYIRRGMTYNYNAPTVAKAMYELAGEYGAAVWDVYEIMGGKDSVIKWRDAGLCKADRLHFTPEGYVLLGDLLYNAIVDDYNAQHLTVN